MSLWIRERMMKKLVCIAAAALAVMVLPAGAADLLVKAPPPAPVPAWSWTGFYIGGNLGGGWAQSEWLEDGSAASTGLPAGLQDASFRATGLMGGGQIGFDYQSGAAVFGVQADADLAHLLGTQQNCFSEVGGPQNCTATIKSVATATGRVGAAFDRALLYVLGGYAWEHAGLENPLPTFGINSFASETRSGWTLGAGLEYALTRNWSAFLQYNYMGFGTRDLLFVGVPAAAGNFTEDVRENINVVKAGINYRFH
jgi:outer membrane immunogenic protein